MNTDARRRASATFAARMKTEGYRKVTVWLSPQALARLDVARGLAGSKDKAVEAALMAGGVTVPKTPKSPPTARKTVKAAAQFGHPGPARPAYGALLKK